jgi:hypothetical protein
MQYITEQTKADSKQFIEKDYMYKYIMYNNTYKFRHTYK